MRKIQSTLVMRPNQLRRIIGLLKRIDKRNFHIGHYHGNQEYFARLIEDRYNICGTTGCIIGHAVSLNRGLMDMLVKQANTYNFHRLYARWSVLFTGVDSESNEWYFMFSGRWQWYDNTIEGAIDRIQAVINGTWRFHKHIHIYLEHINSGARL